jgi:sporulation protein YlmC with PRC-barrel domain
MSPTKHCLLSLNRREAALGVLSAATLGAVASVGVARAQAVRLVSVDVMAVGEGYRVSKLTGRNVQNDKDEKIGTLDDFIITKDKDRNLFAILQVGGFLGLGGHLIAIPYESLSISPDGQKITLAGASKEAVKSLPEFKFKN